MGRAGGSGERLARSLAGAISDERVLDAVATVPRDRFVAERDRRRAWANRPLALPCDQTISQPLVVARMCELLELDPAHRVLDVGTGSGYHAAVLAQLARHVWSIERHPELASMARRNLAAAGVANVTVLTGDGTGGHPPAAPFDAINVGAAAPTGPPAALEAQLAPGGRLVVPVGAGDQHLVLVRRSPEGLHRVRREPVRFVPLIGEE